MAPQQSASLSRSKASPQHLAALSDQLLQASLDRTSSPTCVPSSSSGRTASSSVSMSRTSTSRADLMSQANSLLHVRGGASHARNPLSSNTAPASVSRARSAAQQRSTLHASTRSPPTHRPDPSSLKRQLQHEVNNANARSHRAPTTGLFRKMCSTDVLFLIDTTFSMGPYIDSVRDQVKSIVADIKRTFLHEAHVRISVVSYKDHGFTPDTQLQSLDFTESIDQVHEFLDRLSAGGTTTRNMLDWPEDVLGGLNLALKQSWKQQTRCLVHIADAPPHGRTLHDLPADSDDFYIPGSEPHKLSHQSLLRKAIQININYALLRITQGAQGTDRMALAFSHAYGVDNATLLPSNLYFHDLNAAKASSSAAADGPAKLFTEPQLEELALGTTYSDLRHLVCKTVTNSFTRTAGRMTLAHQARGPAASHMSVIDEDEDGATSSSQVSLETSTPRWSDPSWFTESFDLEGFCPAGVHDFGTLNEMMADDVNINLSTAEFLVRARSKPFARGAMRTASYACTAASDNPFVFKDYMKPGQHRPAMVEDMRIQALCKAFALEFNGLLNIEPLLDFVVTSCLTEKEASTGTSGSPARCISLEPYIEGTYVKYNNNHTYVNPDSADEFNRLVQAFSHFTFERSYGLLLVNDLQGVASSRTLTDPAVQTMDPERFKLTDANLGEASIKLFFVVHECNRYCHQLGLESSKEMFLPGASRKFRQNWPTPEPTVFCSNKLCRRIMRLAKAEKNPEFPAFQWCSACLPQLERFKATRVCENEGDGDHTFEVSEFFHQSQGEPRPRECERHRPKNAAASTAAAVGGGMFSRMKSKKSTESLASSIAGKIW